MIGTHVASVAACWLIALIGMAMLVRAQDWRSKAMAHGAVMLALMLLSVMALDHVHHPDHHGFVAGNQSDWYHVTTCPIVAKQKLPLIPLKDEQEARDSGRTPHDCVALASHVQGPPEHRHDDGHQADSSE